GAEVTVDSPLPQPLPHKGGRGASALPRCGPIPPLPLWERGLGGEGAPRRTPAHRHHLVLLAQNITGYQNLCSLLTHSYNTGGQHDPHLPFDLLAQHAASLLPLS